MQYDNTSSDACRMYSNNVVYDDAGHTIIYVVLFSVFVMRMFFSTPAFAIDRIEDTSSVFSRSLVTVQLFRNVRPTLLLREPGTFEFPCPFDNCTQLKLRR